MELDKAREHIGHCIGLVMYGDKNISLECVDCQEVIWDSDIQDE